MKWIAIAAVVIIGMMVITGNMGGATKATNNYVKVRGGG
jgi:type IV secretory pathway VirB2 component (pilin)